MTDIETQMPRTKEERLKKLNDLLINKKTLEDMIHEYDRATSAASDKDSDFNKEKQRIRQNIEKLKVEAKKAFRKTKKNKIKEKLILEQERLEKLENNENEARKEFRLLIEKTPEVNEKINNYLNNFRYGKEYDGELKGIDLSGMNLSGLNFSDLNLEGASLAATISEGLKLNHSNLKEANLSMAVMRRPKLVQTDLTDTKFNENVKENKINIQIPKKFRENKGAYFGGKGTSFVGAILDNVNLGNVNFELVDMDCIHVDGTTFCKNTVFVDEIMLFGTDFSKANVEGVKFNNKTYMGKDQAEVLENRGANVDNTHIISTEKVQNTLISRLEAVEELRDFSFKELANNNSNYVLWQQKENTEEAAKVESKKDRIKETLEQGKQNIGRPKTQLILEEKESKKYQTIGIGNLT